MVSLLYLISAKLVTVHWLSPRALSRLGLQRFRGVLRSAGETDFSDAIGGTKKVRRCVDPIDYGVECSVVPCTELSYEAMGVISRAWGATLRTEQATPGGEETKNKWAIYYPPSAKGPETQDFALANKRAQIDSVSCIVLQGLSHFRFSPDEFCREVRSLSIFRDR